MCESEGVSVGVCASMRVCMALAMCVVVVVFGIF